MLLSSLGYSPTGEAFNLACEDVATSVAVALGADKLILFGEDTGIRDEDGELLRELKPTRAAPLLANLGNSQPGTLLQAACKACNAGLRRSHIVSFAEDGALLTELFTRDGGGTLVSQEAFEQIRGASIDDVGGLLELLRPLEEAGILVRRSREVLETEIGQFTLIERDGRIIGCAALYPLEGSSAAELACVAIDPAYRQGGRGDQLLQHIERQARSLKIDTLFVLTTRTAHWFRERGFEVDHSTINRWVLAYAPVIEKRLRQFRRPHCGSIRIDETYVKICGKWRYLYRAIDKQGNPIDFLLTAKRDLDAAKRFFRKMLKDEPLLSPAKIGTDGANTFPSAIRTSVDDWHLRPDPVHYVTKHLQQGIESDHFRVKKNMPKIGGFQSFKTARRTIAGFEAMLWLRKGFGFSGEWTVNDQNDLLRYLFGLQKVNKA